VHAFEAVGKGLQVQRSSLILGASFAALLGAAVEAQAPTALSTRSVVGCYDVFVSNWSATGSTFEPQEPWGLPDIRLDSHKLTRSERKSRWPSHGFAIRPDSIEPPSAQLRLGAWSLADDGTLSLVWGDGYIFTAMTLTESQGAFSGQLVAGSDIAPHAITATVLMRRRECGEPR